MKLRSALLAATVLAVAPIAAKAQAITGLYIGAGAGANFMQQETVKSAVFPNVAGVPSSAIGSLPGHLSLQAGFVGVASVGYGLGNGLRLEVEGSYRSNKLKNSGVTGAGGDEMKYGGMLNVLYDFDPSLIGLGFLPVVPYVGVGGGYQFAQLKNARLYNGSFVGGGFNPAVPSNLYRTNDGRGDAAYQAIVGASFPIASIPGLSLTAEYRFMGLIGDRTYNMQYFANRPGLGVATRAQVKLNDDYNHSVMVGVRYAFNAAPPAQLAVIPTAAPMREAARTYLVFFDWDRSDLTPRARQVVAEAAQATTRTQVTRIMVNGYTDTSGTATYNQGLSVRRAQTVANELVRDGVPRGAISMQGFGESNLRVPTGNGVREPQNRRVEIIFQLVEDGPGQPATADWASSRELGWSSDGPALFIGPRLIKPWGAPEWG